MMTFGFLVAESFSTIHSMNDFATIFLAVLDVQQPFILLELSPLSFGKCYQEVDKEKRDEVYLIAVRNTHYRRDKGFYMGVRSLAS